MSRLQVVREIFDEALEIEDRHQRQTFVSQACGGDEIIRSEVEDLLKALEDSKNFLSEPKQSFPDWVPFRDFDPNPWEGQVIGPYLLRHKLGEGGVGIVYYAEQREPIRRRVALKLLKPGMDSRTVLARFQLERRALEKMDHPSIAQVLDAGMTGRGHPYFVMEYVEGERITDFCNHRSLPVADRLRLIIQVCNAVQHAHQKGILHRDLKPSNILVTAKHDSGPVPKVIDFGIAKAVHRAALDAEWSTVTASNPVVDGVLGTPSYMSPEQASEGTLDIDTRTDVFSLGVLLYELLIGRPPFSAAWLMQGGLASMRRKIQEAEPLKPSDCLDQMKGEELAALETAYGHGRDLIAGQVRGDLDWIVLKAIAKQRHLRYPTANALAMDLQRHLDHQIVEARPPTAGYRLGRFIQRNRVLVGSCVAACLMLGMGLAFSAWEWRRAVRAEQVQHHLRAVAEQAQERSLVRAYAADMKVASIALGAGNLGQAMNLLDRYSPFSGAVTSELSTASSTAVDVRGFEWYYLRHLAKGQEERSFYQPNMLMCVKIQPQNQWIAAAGYQGDYHVWDVASGELMHTFEGPRSPKTRLGMDVSNDGALLACVTESQCVVRETSHWKPVLTREGEWKSVAFAPRDRWLALSGLRHIEVVDRTTGAPLKTWELPRKSDGLQGGVVFCGPRMDWLAHADDRWLNVFDVRSQSLLWREEVLSESIQSLAVSPNGNFLAMGDRAGGAIVYDLAHRTVTSRFSAHHGWLLGLAFSPEGNRIATAGGDQKIRLWPMDDQGRVGGAIATLSGHLNEVWALAFSTDGKHLASGGKDGFVKWWKAEAPNSLQRRIRIPNSEMLLGFSGDSSCFRILTSTMDLLSISSSAAAANGEPLSLREILGSADALFSKLHFGLNCWYALRQDHSFEVRSYAQGALLDRVELNNSIDRVLASVSSSGRYAVLASAQENKATLWDMSKGEIIASLPGYFDNRSTPTKCRVQFSADELWLTYASDHFGITIWDLKAARVARSIQAHAWEIYSLAFSPNGKTLASACWDGSVALWDVATGNLVTPRLRGHFEGVVGVFFLPDGKTLITEGGERALKFWNVASGTEMLSIPAATIEWAQPVSPDGTRAAWWDTAARQFLLTSISLGKAP